MPLKKGERGLEVLLVLCAWQGQPWWFGYGVYGNGQAVVYATSKL